MDRQLHALPQLQLPLTRPHDHGEFFLPALDRKLKGQCHEIF
jgi:hypothetical protein